MITKKETLIHLQQRMFLLLGYYRLTFSILITTVNRRKFQKFVTFEKRLLLMRSTFRALSEQT